MSVANGWDDLWVEVICQASSEIAGSPRNIFRYSLSLRLPGVELLDGCRFARACIQPNSEYRKSV